MQAAIYERVGPAKEVLNLVDLPIPQPRRNEVRVKLAWSGINPSDVKTRAGYRTKTMPFSLVVPHSDGAGVIDAVGEDISRSRLGERVWLWNAARDRPFGTAAEYIALPSYQAVRLPDSVDLDVGACLGVPALTACHAIATDGGVYGKRVLIAGGAGAVGHYAIQFARLSGAKQIVSTVSSPEKAAIAYAAGADAVLNYKTEDIVARILEITNGQGLDRIVEVDLATNIGADVQVLRNDSDIVVYGSSKPEVSTPFSSLILKNISMHYFIVYNLSDTARRKAIEGLSNYLDRGKLIHNIGMRLPLNQIVEAHELIEQGRYIGNVILAVGQV